MERRPRFDMPIAFGPSHVPPQTPVRWAQSTVIRFQTDPSAARNICPAEFEIPEKPVVTVAHISYDGIEYLGGRGYNEIVLSVSALFKGVETCAAPYVPVLWVDQVGALMTGREFQGFPKLFGEIGRTGAGGTTSEFTCAEYEAPLLKGSICDLQALDESALHRVNRASAEVVSLAWKHIPSVDDIPDADYPTRSVMKWKYDQAWSGRGEVEFFKPDAASAPYSWRAMQAFADLPVLAYQSCFVGIGSAVIDRLQMTRLRRA
jgi:hypothetical protein